MQQKLAQNTIHYINRFTTGLDTFRSALIQPYTVWKQQQFERSQAAIDGVNLELQDDLLWRRRPGLARFSTFAFGSSDSFRDAWSWRSSDGTVRVFADTTANLVLVTPTTSTTIQALTPGQPQVGIMGIQDTLYFSNGTEIKKQRLALAFGSTELTGIAVAVTAPTLTFGAGSLSPTVGFRYVFSYKNSSSGHINTASPVSASTGPLTSQNITVTGARSTDPQVDKIRIYRTKDGGSTLFFNQEINNPGAGSFSFIDSTLDANLTTAESAPINGINNPPPAGALDPVFHMGRPWMHTGNKVYYGAGGDAVLGVPEECWPPSNVLVLPEKIVAKVSRDFGLVCFGFANTYVIRGIDPASFYPEVWAQNMGISTPNNFTVNGQTLYVFTNQRQMLEIGDRVSNIGYSLGGTHFSTFIPANVYVTVHKAGDTDVAVYVSDGSTNVMRFSLALRNWSTPGQPVGSVKMVDSVETSNGVYQLLVGRPGLIASHFLLNRTLTDFSDDGSTYPASVTFGSFVLAPPSQTINVESVLLQVGSAGTFPTVSILPNEISGTFFDIPNPVAVDTMKEVSTTIIAKKLYMHLIPKSNWMEHCQLKVTFTSENANNVLYGVGFYKPEMSTGK